MYLFPGKYKKKIRLKFITCFEKKSHLKKNDTLIAYNCLYNRPINP